MIDPCGIGQSLIQNTIEQQEQPALAIVYFGGNDSHLEHESGLGPHVPLKEYIENMRKIADYLKVKFVILEFHFPIYIKFNIYLMTLNVKFDTTPND